MRTYLLPLVLPSALAAQGMEVDVELFLAVDVSRSMSAEELEIQRRGYAEALISTEVMAAIETGLLGRIAISYVEWAGETAQRVVIPWQVLQTPKEAQDIAARILATKDASLRRTSISGALDYATASILDNEFDGLRRVIDVSGDGPNNQGRAVEASRDAALSHRITINGLPMLTQDLLSEIWGIPDLDIYYENCVIGGPGSFVVPVIAWDQFAEAVKRKLVLEIAAAPASVIPVQYTPDVAYNCLIGEQMWRENRTYFDIP